MFYPLPTLTMAMIEEVEGAKSGGFWAILAERIILILRETHIESCEWAAIVLHATWFIPMLFDRDYLMHSPYARTVILHIPGGLMSVMWVAGSLLFAHFATCILGGKPSAFIRDDRDQYGWYAARITCTILSCMWFCLVGFLYTQGQVTGGTVLFGSASIVEYVGSHKLYKLLAAERSYQQHRREQRLMEEVIARMKREEAHQ